MKMVLILYLLFLLLTVIQGDFHVRSRYDYYTNDTTASIMIISDNDSCEFDFIFEIDGKQILEKKNLISPGKYCFVFSSDFLSLGETKGKGIFFHNKKRIVKNIVFTRFPYKNNEVKIDYWTGSLISSDKPFFPFGFYCYSPLQKTLPEEESARGFNLFSPYQKIEDSTWKDRLAYLDRAADLGMKVNYQLLSIAENGGIGSALLKGLSKEKKREMLIQEINRVKDHPALLSWYLCDEPIGQNISKNDLLDEYELIKKLDPYHPVTIVFMTPSEADEYKDVMDIVMADPYPIPNKTVLEVADVSFDLETDFRFRMPYWIVPQTFGGNEWWRREPVAEELRAMVYLSILHGATGSQAFIRHGHNGFPKSLSLWEEYGKIAREIRELTPFLLKGNRDNQITNIDHSLFTRTWELDRQQLIIVINSENEFKNIVYENSHIIPSDGTVKVLFENRNLSIENHRIKDIIEPFGRKVYLIEENHKENNDNKNNNRRFNLQINPSFEKYYSAGVPFGCYVSVQGDRGAGYYVDPLESFHGKHSLKLMTPTDDNGVVISFYPVDNHFSSSFYIRFAAKGNFASLYSDDNKSHELSYTFAGVSDTVPLTSNWKLFENFIDYEKIKNFPRAGLSFQLLDPGEAWIDDIFIAESPSLTCCFSKEKNCFLVRAHAWPENQTIEYSLDNGNKFQRYEKEFELKQSSVIFCRTIENNRITGMAKDSVFYHLGLNGYIKIVQEPDRNDSPILYDGFKGSSNFSDGRWVGFEGRDMDIDFHFNEKIFINEIKINFLQDQNNWIFSPVRIRIFVDSGNGDYQLLEQKTFTLKEETSIDFQEFFFSIKKNVRSIKIIAENIRLCPEWHKGHGKPSWIFCDEIIFR